MSGILLVSKEKSTSAILTKLLKTEGYKVTAVGDASRARETVGAESFDLMIADIGKGKESEANVDMVIQVLAEKTGLPVIVLVENDGGVSKDRFSEQKVFACVEKPLRVDNLVALVQKAVDQGGGKAEAEDVSLNLELETFYQFDNIVAESPAMKSLCEMISRIAGTDVTVLIFGESGTGKGLLASIIHSNSRRKNGVLVPVLCGNPGVEAELFGQADKEGALEKADKGTLLLEDIDALPLPVQKKLLQGLRDRATTRLGATQSKATDIRVVATTAKDLQQGVIGGQFLPDLYKLLRIIYLQIPPMRKRREDIMPTVRQILREKCPPGKGLPSIGADVVAILEKYPWPGNVKQMQDVLAKAMAASTGNRITKENLPPELLAG